MISSYSHHTLSNSTQLSFSFRTPSSNATSAHNQSHSTHSVNPSQPESSVHCMQYLKPELNGFESCLTTHALCSVASLLARITLSPQAPYNIHNPQVRLNLHRNPEHPSLPPFQCTTNRSPHIQSTPHYQRHPHKHPISENDPGVPPRKWHDPGVPHFSLAPLSTPPR